jgi:hypothetical protein
MVLVLVIAVSLAIIVMAIQSARGTSRRTQCQNNLHNIGLALLNLQTSKNYFPNAGTFYDDPENHQGDPLKSTIYRVITNAGAHPGDADCWLHSWVIDCSPYFDVSDYYNAWDKQTSSLSDVHSKAEFPDVSNSYMLTVSIGVLRCPADPTAVPDHGNLSYVVNGGFARWPAVPIGWSGSRIDGRANNGAVLQWATPRGTWQDNQPVGKKLGVVFLGTHTGKEPWDIATAPADIADGAANTLLVGENTLAGYSKGTPYSGGFATNYACPLRTSRCSWPPTTSAGRVVQPTTAPVGSSGATLVGLTARGGRGPTKRGRSRTSISGSASPSKAHSPSPTAVIPAGPTLYSAMARSAL